jgi:hypothetical protein
VAVSTGPARPVATPPTPKAVVQSASALASYTEKLTVPSDVALGKSKIELPENTGKKVPAWAGSAVKAAIAAATAAKRTMGFVINHLEIEKTGTTW